MEQKNLAFVAQEWLQPLTDLAPDCRAEVIVAIVEYQLTGAEPNLRSDMARLAFAYIKPNVERMAEFRRTQSERRKAAKPRTAKTGDEPKITGDEPDVTETDQYSKSKSESKTKSQTKTKGEEDARASRVDPPTVFEIEDFCKAEGITNVDAQNFWSYYDARAWTTAQGNPVHSWQAQIRKWAATEQQKPTPAQVKPAPAPARMSAEELALRDAAEMRERAERKREIDYYISTVPGANTPSAVISYPEFCSLGLHAKTPQEIAGVLDLVRSGVIPRNPLFATRRA